MKRASMVAPLLLLALGLGSVPAGAHSSYLDAALQQYPGIQNSQLNNCTLCHTSVPSLDPYGSDYRGHDRNFAAIELLDSDHDGFSNIAEILALTFPGDASSVPSGGGGPGRVQSLKVLDNGSDYGAVEVAYDPDRNQFLTAWVEATSSGHGVFTRRLSADGTPLGSAVMVSKTAADCCDRIGLAYGNGVYLAAYQQADGRLMAQKLDSTGKGKGAATLLATAGSGPSVAFQAASKNYFVSYAGTDGSLLQTVSAKGKLVGNAQPLRMTGGGTDYLVRQLTIHPSSGELLSAGAELKSAKARPAGLGFDMGLITLLGPFIYSNKFTAASILQMDVAFRSGGPGLIAWDSSSGSSSKGYIRPINAGGAPLGAIQKLSGGRPAGLNLVAEELDGQFLLIWVDLNARSVYGLDLEDTGTSPADKFTISDQADSVASGFAAAAYGSRQGETAVLYTRAGSAPAVLAALVNRP